MSRGSLLRWLLGVAVLALALAVPTPSQGAGGSRDPEPPRLLLLGDSVTQGSAGDWTWRYRLWRHLAGTKAGVDLVGPHDDLYDNVASAQGSGAYNDPAFDTDHAARWGRTALVAVDLVGDLVTTYQPHVLVAMLGVNDLTFLERTPEQVAGSMRDLVAAARQSDPGVDVVLVHQVETWYAGVPAFNVLLDDLAEELDSVGSRVVVAAPDEGFALTDDTWDPAHPNARGEVKVAAAVADALAGLGVAQPYPRPLPDLPLGPRSAPVLSATGHDGGVSLTWTGPPGATAERIWLRDATAGEAWRMLPDPVPEPFTEDYGVEGLVNGHTYALRLQPAKGYWPAAPDVRSNVVRVRPLPPLPGGVRISRAWSPGRDRVRVTGFPVPGATGYRLEAAPVRSCDRAPAFTRRVTGLSRPAASLTTRAAYLRVRLVALNLAGAGPASATGRCVRVR